VRRLADNLREDIRSNMRGLRADLAATAEAARAGAASAAFSALKGSAAADGKGSLKEAELMLQAFRDDLRAELRQQAGKQPLSPVVLETVRTVLEQAAIAVRNSLRN
jgi:hypothetical protein